MDKGWDGSTRRRWAGGIIKSWGGRTNKWWDRSTIRGVGMEIQIRVGKEGQ
jgi:hypothetical protein